MCHIDCCREARKTAWLTDRTVHSCRCRQSRHQARDEPGPTDLDACLAHTAAQPCHLPAFSAPFSAPATGADAWRCRRRNTEIRGQAEHRFAHRGIALQIHVFVLDAAPELLDEAVVEGAPRPSLRMSTPSRFRMSVKAARVNCAPGSRLKTSGRPGWRQASSRPSTQNSAFLRLLIRQRSTRREYPMIATR